ncbi:MAG: hypothetical protein AB9907_07080 [Flexilinea sp.]
MNKNNWKTKALLYGAGIGMATGLIIAYIKIRNAESKNEIISFNTKDTAKVGMAIYEILKKIA